MFAKPADARQHELNQLGLQQFRDDRQYLQASLWGYWQWSVLDLKAEGPRRSLAEFLLTQALGLDGSRERQPGLDWDLASAEGLRIKLESQAVPDCWPADRIGAATFPILARRVWEQETGRLAQGLSRPADVYVFARLALPGASSPHPLEVQHWSFYLVARRALDAQEGAASAISLQTLRVRCGRSPLWRGPVALRAVKLELAMLAKAL